jgi:hypothetical protein
VVPVLAAVGQLIDAVRFAPAGVDAPVGEHDLGDRYRAVAPAAVGERRVDVGHLERGDAEFEPAERLRREAFERADDAHLVRHFGDGVLTEVGGELRVDGVVGFERRRDEVDRPVLLATERFDFVGRVLGQPAR